jgi:hypothetical protein
MANEIELVSDGDGLVVLGASVDVERFLHSTGLDQTPQRNINVHHLSSLLGMGGAAMQVGANLAENSGRWVKLTAESAKAVKEFGLMPTTTQGVSHAMIGNRGDIKQWIQIIHSPTALLSGPLALTALSTMMQQRAMQQQMDEIVEYLEEINEKVDDILRSQKDAVLADMIGVDLIIQDALTVRDHVGRVSEVTWSKVQATGMTLARTQAYALLQLDAIAEKVKKKADLGDIAKITRGAEPRIQEWLGVIARTVLLQDGFSILELDRVLDSTPDDLDSHRLGVSKSRQQRLELIARSTDRILSQMNETVERANGSVLFNPFDAPAAVKSSNQVAVSVLDFRGRVGLESDSESEVAKRWGRAVAEVRDKALASASEGASAAAQIGAGTFNRAAEVFRAIDIDGDGVPDKARAAAAAENASAAVKGAASNVTGAIGSVFRRKADKSSSAGKPLSETTEA